MTLQEINDLTRSECLETLYLRIVTAKDDPLYSPSIEELDAELILYKAELTAEEEYRLETEDIKLRIAAVERYAHQVIVNDPLAIPNTKVFFAELLKSENRLARMEAIEAEYLFIAPELDYIADLKVQEAMGAKVHDLCRSLKHLIIAANAGLTKEAILQMKIDYATVKEYIWDDQPWSAREELILLEDSPLKTTLLKCMELSGLEGL